MQPTLPDFSSPEVRTTFYQSKEWQKLRRFMLQMNPNCQKCGGYSNTVDHIIDIAVDPSKRLDPNNLRCFCTSCHNRRTSSSDRNPMRKGPIFHGGANGEPLEPNHPWNLMKVRGQ
jgi:5-methylcytosine-specific restriction endonuclease McrA